MTFFHLLKLSERKSQHTPSTATATSQTSSKRRAIAIGNFDGVHQGHRVLLRDLQDYVPQFTPTVLSFYPHPLEVLTQIATTNTHSNTPKITPAPILGMTEKLRRLADAGVAQVIAHRFTPEFSNWSAEHFVEELLVKKLHAGHVCLGENFRFGHGRKGDVTLLREMGQRFGFSVNTAPLKMDDQLPISSGRIRHMLAQGDLQGANRLLGEAYRVTGRVIHGMKLGRTLNIPTLNLKMPMNHQGQAAVTGVFVVRVHGLGERALNAVASVGRRPTVENSGRVLLEVHVFDFQQNCYGHRIQVEFLHKLREELRFDSVAELVTQMQLDLQAARDFHQAAVS